MLAKKEFHFMGTQKDHRLDPAVLKFIDALASQGGPPIYKLPVAMARQVLSVAQAGDAFKFPVDMEERTIPVGPKGNVKIRVVRPKGNATLLPVVLYMHGGGWVLGDALTHDRLVRDISVVANAAVVFVDYSRAPEEQYPTAHEEGYATAQWIEKNGATLNLDGTRMAIAGDSAGGLMATAITLMAKKRSGPKFIFQLLFYPVTDANFNTSSYQEFATGYFLEREGMKWFWDCYAPDKTLRKDPFVAPLNASLDDLQHLPPALIIVGECDVLRDEGEAYAHKLLQAGVPVAAYRTLGLTHDFVMLNALAHTPGAQAAILLGNQAIQVAFQKSASKK
jgi:acetyl esterase